MRKNNLKKKNKGYFRNGLKDSIDFVKLNSNNIKTISYIFAIFLIVAFFIPTPELLSRIIQEKLRLIVLETQNLDTLQLVQYIFLNNAGISLMALILGILFGILPVLFAISNGYIIGYVARLAVDNNGILFLWRIFPHGIFELPAVIISLALGFGMGRNLFNKKPKFSLYSQLKLSLKTFFYIVLPLLILAAFIEGILIVFFG